MKILVVDDSQVMRKLVIRSIRQAGFGDATICEASDGQEAIEVNHAELPDLILADWNMPNMTGIEMLKQLRTCGDQVRVGFVTSESTAQIRLGAKEAGASFFISKPVESDKLAIALRSVATRGKS